MRQNSFILCLFYPNINFLLSFTKAVLSLPAPFRAGVRVRSHRTGSGWMGAPSSIEGLKPTQTPEPVRSCTRTLFCVIPLLTCAKLKVIIMLSAEEIQTNIVFVRSTLLLRSAARNIFLSTLDPCAGNTDSPEQSE